MNRDALLEPVPIRFSSTTKKRVEATAKRFGLKSSELVRRAVESKLPQWELEGVLIIEAKQEAK
jgi:predicted DNA-binding protein